jgi:prephenate dehydrogenase
VGVNMNFKNVMVVGLGLIGGSLAMALKENNDINIIGFDRNLDALKEAKSRNVISDYCTEPAQVLPECDLIVIALYPNDTVEFIRNNVNHFKSGAIIIDTAGIKNELIRDVQDFLREDVEFIGTHPMAGKAETGFKSADRSIFSKCKYIITPTARNKEENINKVIKLLKTMGAVDIVTVSPEEHDKIIAYTSHLTHVVAVSLICSGKLNVDVSDFIAGSFKDMTRVAAINGALWQELLISNSENIVSVIEDFEKHISMIKKAISEQDRTKLLEIFNEAHTLRKEIKL